MVTRRRGSEVLAIGASAVLLLGACAGGDGDVADSETVVQNGTNAEDVQDAQDAPDAADPAVPPEDVVNGPGPDEPDPDGDGELAPPGEQVETYFSTPGQEVGVAGLAPESGPLPVRTVPAGDGMQIGEIDRLGAVTLAGREWNNPGQEDEGYWAEIHVDGKTGWVLSDHLFHFGENANVTGEYEGVPPSGDPMGVVEAVASQSAGMEPAHWTLISTPQDFGEPFYRVDVTGMPDDAQAGERLFITVDENNGSFGVGQVDRTLVCARGTSGGMCL